MKRINFISLTILILIFSGIFVFAVDDYIVGNENPVSSENIQDSLDNAQLRSDISKLNAKLDEIKASTDSCIKSQDVIAVQNEFFSQAQREMDEFSTKLLIMILVFSLFLFVSFFLLKAKRLI